MTKRGKGDGRLWRLQIGRESGRRYRGQGEGMERDAGLFALNTERSCSLVQQNLPGESGPETVLRGTGRKMEERELEKERVRGDEGRNFENATKKGKGKEQSENAVKDLV